ncbi:MAG: DUF445 domain-containing protein [Solirubrobacterales bacterium]
MDAQTISDLTIPLFTGAIGYVTNWTGVWMLFYPLEFKGVRVPGLARLAHVLPRRIQQIPGVIKGGIGWQGIIPSRAAKMGSIAVDKGIAKIGTGGDFYQQLDPEQIAEQILDSARGDIRDVVNQVMQREHPGLWNDVPGRLREAVHARVQAQLPDIVRDVTERIGTHIDQLVDPKLMVIRHIEANPELANRIFLEVGKKELRFIVNFGFFFGLLCGIPLVFLTHAIPQWWVLPIGGVIIGSVTNWLALWMIFEPTEPKRFGPLKLHGLFLRRRPEVSEVYGEIIAEDIITARNMSSELLEGPSADRTRALIEDAMRPAIDRSVGAAQTAVRVVVGSQRYDAIREGLATEAVTYTVTPLSDPEFNRRQSARMRELITGRMRELPYADFAELLRSGMREDEWLLILHGGVLGFVAGLIHLAIFGV